MANLLLLSVPLKDILNSEAFCEVMITNFHVNFLDHPVGRRVALLTFCTYLKVKHFEVWRRIAPFRCDNHGAFRQCRCSI